LSLNIASVAAVSDRRRRLEIDATKCGTLPIDTY